MSLKSFAAGLLAKYVTKKQKQWAADPVGTQRKVFEQLVGKAAKTQFGRDHDFENIKTPADFAQRDA